MTRKEFFDRIEEKNKIVITALDALETPDIGDIIEVGEEQILIDKKEK